MMRKLMIGALVAAAFAGGVLAQGLNVGLTGRNTLNAFMGFQVGMLEVQRQSTITAFAGGGQASATQLVYGLNRVTVVATANDSVKLPQCLNGKVVIVVNADAADSMDVYGQSGETINAITANSPFAVAANKMAIFACAVDGKWYSLLTA